MIEYTYGAEPAGAKGDGAGAAAAVDGAACQQTPRPSDMTDQGEIRGTDQITAKPQQPLPDPQTAGTVGTGHVRAERASPERQDKTPAGKHR